MSEAVIQTTVGGFIQRQAARMWRFLFDIEQPKAMYVVKAVALTWLGGMVLSVLIGLTYPGPTDQILKPNVMSVLLVVVIAPWVETWIMVPVLWMLQKFTLSRLRLCILSGLIFGILHLSSVSWGFFGAWAFFVLTACFLAWRQVSRERAIIMTSLVHMGVNTTSAVIYAAANGGG